MSREYPIKVVCVSLDHSEVSQFWQHAFVIGKEYWVREDDRVSNSAHLKYICEVELTYILVIPKSHFRVVNEILTDPIDAHNIVFNPKIETNE